MADEMATVAYEHVHTAEGMVGVIVVETITESSVPESVQVRTCRCVDLVTLKHGNLHRLQLTT